MVFFIWLWYASGANSPVAWQELGVFHHASLSRVGCVSSCQLIKSWVCFIMPAYQELGVFHHASLSRVGCVSSCQLIVGGFFFFLV